MTKNPPASIQPAWQQSELSLAISSYQPGRFFFFNITVGGVCWACLFGFGAYAVGAEIYTISGTLSVISSGLFIATGFALSVFMRRNEVTLRRRAEVALLDHFLRMTKLLLVASFGLDATSELSPL